LTDSGKITTPEERKELFKTMLDVNTERQKEGKAPIYSIKEVFYEHYKKDKQPAGADAPISMGKGVNPPEEKDINYAEVHKKSFADILMGK
jgi:hypothetical protein